MNYQFDIIIIGDSKHGNEVLKLLAAARPSIKIAFISREFKSTTTRDFINVEYIKAEVSFTDYRNRLFGCYLDTGDRLFCTHLIVASGRRYAPFTVGNKYVPNVFNSVSDVPKVAKHQQAVVIGDSDADVKFAAAVAKKYKYVYFCTKSLAPDITEANVKKLEDIKNLVVLHNTSISKFTSVDGNLSSVELDNYSSLTCSAIFIKTETSPETDFVPDKLISKDAKDYFITSKQLESTIVPKCFAVGNCTIKNTKKMTSAMVEYILNDFGGAIND